MAVTRLRESASTDRQELQILHDNLTDQLHQAYMTASEMLLYCRDEDLATYEAEAERILEFKYRMKDLQRSI